MPTPESGRQQLVGVVGYPFDLDEGEYMYEHFLSANWSLATADTSMLEYYIDTSKGMLASDVPQKLLRLTWN